MREYTEYAAVKTFLFLARLMPVSLLYLFFDALARLYYRLGTRRRELTRRNLAMAFPDKSEAEIDALAKRVYRELGQTVTEILLMFADRFDIDEAVVNKVEALHRLDWLKIRHPGGIVAMTAHFGNWELLAHFLAMHGFRMLVIGREGNNRLIETRITQPFRKKYGNDTAYKDNAMLAMVKRLKRGGNVGLLIDQKSGHLNSVNVPFFGKKVDTTNSIAMLRAKLPVEVVPFFAVRVGRGKYRIEIGDPIPCPDETCEDIEAMTREYNRMMERVIRAHPEQWFWMHNRWRL